MGGKYPPAIFVTIQICMNTMYPWSTKYCGFRSQGCTTRCNAAHWAGGSTGAFAGQWLCGNMSATWQGQRVLLFAPIELSKYAHPQLTLHVETPRDMNFSKEFRNWNAGLCYIQPLALDTTGYDHDGPWKQLVPCIRTLCSRLRWTNFTEWKIILCFHVISPHATWWNICS